MRIARRIRYTEVTPKGTIVSPVRGGLRDRNETWMMHGTMKRKRESSAAREGTRKQIEFRVATYFGVCDVVGRHGLGNSLQGAPHVSGHL